MGADQWLQIEELFAEALALGPSERAAFLENRCGQDPDLLRQVSRLLDNDSRAGPQFLERPAFAGLDGAPAADARELRIGERVGAYTIKDTIARGGMGTVYRAEQDNPHRDVALKVLHAGLWSPAAARRFEFESRILARVQHPHIAQIFEAGVFSPSPSPGKASGACIVCMSMPPLA